MQACTPWKLWEVMARMQADHRLTHCRTHQLQQCQVSQAKCRGFSTGLASATFSTKPWLTFPCTPSFPFHLFLTAHANQQTSPKLPTIQMPIHAKSLTASRERGYAVLYIHPCSSIWLGKVLLKSGCRHTQENVLYQTILLFLLFMLKGSCQRRK